MSDNTAEVKFGAETSGLKAGTDEAQIMVERLTSSMTAGFKGMAESVTASMNNVTQSVKVGVKESGEHLETFNKGLASVQKGFQLIAEAAMIGFVGDRILEVAKKTAEYAHEMEMASQKTGMSTDALQGWGAAAKISGASTENMMMGIRKLSQAIIGAQEGQEKYQDQLAKVGITSKDYEAAGKDLEGTLYRIADAYHEHNDGAGKVANAQALMGRGGMALIPMFNNGSEKIREMIGELHKMGAVMSEEDIQKAAALHHELELMELGMDGLKRKIGTELVPIIKTLAEAFIEIDQRGGTVTQMAAGLANVLKVVSSFALGVISTFQIVGRTLAMVGAEIVNLTPILLPLGQMLDALSTGNLPMLVEATKGVGKSASGIFNAYLEDVDKTLQANGNLINSFWKADQAIKGEGKEGGKKDMPTTPPKGTTDESQLPAFREELEQKKVAEGEYFKDSRAADVQYWNDKLKLVKEKSKDWYAIEHEIYQLKKELAIEDSGVQITNLKAVEADTQASWKTRLKAAESASTLMANTYGADSREYAQSLKEKERLNREFVAQTAQLSELRLSHEKAMNLAATDAEKDRTSYLRSIGAITDAEAIQREIQTENRIYAIKKEAAVKAAQVEGLSLVAKLKVDQEIENAEREHGRKIGQLNQQAAVQASQKWQAMYTSITSAMSSSISGMIKGTMTFQEAMKNMASSMIDVFINMCMQMVAKWVWGQMVKLICAETTDAAVTTSSTTAASMKLTEDLATNTIAAASFAALAATAAMSSVACIPFIGWAMAPAVGATTYAEGMTFAALASASGGYDIPAGVNPVTQLHQNEMVLPADIAQPMRKAIKGGGGVGGGETHIHIHAIDSKSFKQTLQEHGSTLAGILSKQARNGVFA